MPDRFRGRTRYSCLVAAALLAGCATEPADDPVVVSPTASPATAAAPARVVLTLTDHARTVRVSRTARITLVLGGRYRWSRPVSTGVAVDAQETVSDAATGIQEWELRPAGTGRAVVTAKGTPACRPATPSCPPAERDFRVTLDVGD